MFLCQQMGKVNQLGNLYEVLELCKLDDTFLPCVDFGHLNAREFGYIKGKAEYEKIIEDMEKPKYCQECFRHSYRYSETLERKVLHCGLWNGKDMLDLELKCGEYNEPPADCPIKQM